jgi:predicted phage terminase large subunit-like protein
VLSVDANQCKGAKNSFSVIQVWMASDKHFFLLDQWREQCNYEELRVAYRRLCNKYNPVAALIERAANGYQLIRDAKRRTNRLVVEIIPDQRSKQERLAAQIATIKAGRIRLPLHADFVNAYIAEFTASKRTAFDQIDATVQYLAWAVDQPPLRPARARALGAKANSQGCRSW